MADSKSDDATEATPDVVADAVDTAAQAEAAEAVVEAEAPRDERRDSLDPATGALSAEALAIRRMEAQGPNG